MDNITLALMCGNDFPIPECQLIVHQPQLKDIAFFGEQNFFIAAQIVGIDKKTQQVETEEQRLELLKLNNFDLFNSIINNEMMKEKKHQIIQFLNLFFPSYKISFTPRAIIFNKEQEFFTINEENFEIFQSVINRIVCLSQKQAEENFNPQGQKAKEIAEKLLKARKKVAELKGEGEQNSIFSQYLSTLCVGLHLELSDLMKLTIFQIYDLIERYSLYINWQLDIQTRLAGGNPDNQPENWMKPIH